MARLVGGFQRPSNVISRPKADAGRQSSLARQRERRRINRSSMTTGLAYDYKWTRVHASCLSHPVWVTFTLSDGKCNVILGIIQLIVFAQCMEKDYHAVQKGILITYGGTSHDTWEEVVTALGMAPPTKQKYTRNDGRAPDTTNKLLDKKHSKPKKLGQPVGSQNVNQSAMTTYQSYTAGTTAGSLNQCWQTATLKSLYALFGPSWS
ncbi:uncharacterized protein MELLADRAFT_86000 [Melampsora larici-populina 98AG31]|uniref:Uncharacterized protein n=1 Tax=Melampsora larici-populina (strain 98AG31 / pathotype 3-4-7) TaxID=747676 RepID=F4RKF0_MELLP|nr:uncharacterized protein MELLADRAFT_86000 [Melampsora larici-populina 98AG31]EGG07193.1 hypothetical protein MELLADRAFT_86000 [Melampsora larici-populina 98AG31]